MSESLARAVHRALEELSTAERLLDEIGSIGVWFSSDDCSFNRQRRRGLRETDGAVSAAHRAVEPFQAELPGLVRDLQALIAKLEPLPGTIPDTMADRDLGFDVTIIDLRNEVTRLQELAKQVLARTTPA